MSQVTPIAAVPAEIDLTRGYATLAFGVNSRPSHLAITPPRTSRAEARTVGKLDLGVSSG